MVTLLLTACIPYDRDASTPTPTPVPTPAPIEHVVDVGPEGGFFELGTARMSVPEGAVSQSVQIRVVETDRDPPDPYEGLSRVWRFEPAGLTFAVPIEVGLRYEPTGDPALLYWSTPNGEGYRRRPTVVDEPGWIVGRVDHFSEGFVAVHQATTVEQPPELPPADVLMVVDNSCSMYDKQQQLAANAAGIVDRLADLGVDFHLGVTSTDMNSTAVGNSGRLRPASGHRFIDPTTPDPAQVFSQMVQLGTNGYFDEMGRAPAYTLVELQSSFPANQDFVRADASLSIVFISDEEDYSGAAPISRQGFIDWMANLRERPSMVRAHGMYSLPGTSCGDAGTEYFAVIDASGGVSGNICQQDWSPRLDLMFDTLLDTARVTLVDQPGAIDEVVLLMADGPLPLTPDEYDYDPFTGRLFFDRGVRVSPADMVRVSY